MLFWLPVFGMRDQNKSVTFAADFFFAFCIQFIYMHVSENSTYSYSTRHMASFASEKLFVIQAESFLYKEIQASNHGPFQMSNYDSFWVAQIIDVFTNEGWKKKKKEKWG